MEESKSKVYSNSGNTDVINLVPITASYILDIGCGDGANARLLKKKGCIIDGITLSENEKEIAKLAMRNVYIHDAESGLPITGEGIYDVVICSHVLEHICYPGLLMKDIYRVLKANGILVVALPNLMHYQSRWKLIQGDFKYQSAGIWDYTHFRWYTFTSAQELLIQHKFKIEVATVTGVLPFNSMFKKFYPKM